MKIRPDMILPIALICLNAGAAAVYAITGNMPKAAYWLCAAGLNLSILWMR